MSKTNESKIIDKHYINDVFNLLRKNNLLSLDKIETEKINYDFTKLKVLDVKPGGFFKSSQDPLFVYEDNEGILNIFTSYLGSERKVSGSGNLAIITFESKASGTSTINFSDDSELVDKDDIPITIKGFGKGSINAK